MPSKKIGLLGGSFNPAHEGHLYISEHALKLLELDEIWWLVSPQNPLKSETEMAPLEERTESAQKIAINSNIKVTNLESELNTQYSIDTIKAIKEKNPQDKFVWLIGADNLANFDMWKDWQEIFKSIPIAVFDREPYSRDALESKAATEFKSNKMEENNSGELTETEPPAWVYLKIPTHPASSTNIRKLED